MKVIVVSDNDGQIVAVATPGSGFTGKVGADPGMGKHVSEVERPDVEDTLRPEHLRELAATFRINVSTGELARR
jgi:hypothetical protein